VAFPALDREAIKQAGVQTRCVLLGPARLTDVGQLPLCPDPLHRDLAVVLEEILVLGSIVCAVLGTDPHDPHTRSIPSECSRLVAKCLDEGEEGGCSTVESLVVVERRRRFAVELGSLRGAIVDHPLDGVCRRHGEWDCVRIWDPLVVAVVVRHLVVNCS